MPLKTMEHDDFVLPRDTASFGPSQPRNEGYGINPGLENLFLAFYRLAPRDLGDDKSAYLQALADRWDANGPAQAWAEALAERQQARLDGLAQQQGWHTATLALDTAARLASGLGYDNAFENGMTLHPLYGVPYLPGTAVKGVARSYAVEVAGADAARIRTVFGSPPEAAPNSENGGSDKQLGAVRFFDAHPPSFPKLEVDVMTPHYPDYYQGDEPPHDGQQPKIIPFLTVAAGESYRFALASREAGALREARRWLRGGLRELGIGGKTSAGYGVFWSGEDRAEARRELQDAKRNAEEKQREAKREQREEAIAEAEWLDDVGQNTDDIPAEVVDNSSKPLQVKIFVRAYKGQVLDCGGLRNLDDFPPGTRFYVRVGTYSNNRGLIDVTYHHR